MNPNGILFLVVGMILLFSGCIVDDALSSLQGGTAPAPSSSEPPSASANDASAITPAATDSDNNPLSQADSPPSAPTPNTNNPSANDPSTTSPPATSTTDDLDGLTPNAETSLIFQALDDAGIRDAAVEFQTDNILIAFNLPSGMTSEDAAYFAIGAASQFAAPNQFIWVQVFENAVSKTYSVKADFVQKYSRGQLNANQLQAVIQVE